MKKLLYILIFLSSWSYAQQEIELCGGEQIFNYWAPHVGNGTTEWTLSKNGVDNLYTGNEISITWSDSGTYVLSAIRYDGPCPSNEVSYTITVTQCDDLIYWVPNTFTPDGDSDNEEWGPVFTAGYDENSFSLIVLNRWGGIIWESRNPNAKWDGTYDNKPYQEGVYTWVMKFSLIDSPKKIKKQGHVTLIR